MPSSLLDLGVPRIHRASPRIATLSQPESGIVGMIGSMIRNAIGPEAGSTAMPRS